MAAKQKTYTDVIAPPKDHSEQLIAIVGKLIDFLHDTTGDTATLKPLHDEVEALKDADR